MADDYTGIFTHTEEQAKDLLSADAEIGLVSGTRIEVKTFEDEPRETALSYADYELPAIAVSCDILEGDVDVSIGGLVAIVIGVNIFVITEAADQGARMTLCKDIAARVITIMGQQYGANQLSGLDDLVADADTGSVFTTVRDAVFDEVISESEPYRAIGELLFGVQIDITR